MWWNNTRIRRWLFTSIVCRQQYVQGSIGLLSMKTFSTSFSCRVVASIVTRTGLTFRTVERSSKFPSPAAKRTSITRVRENICKRLIFQPIWIRTWGKLRRRIEGKTPSFSGMLRDGCLGHSKQLSGIRWHYHRHCIISVDWRSLGLLSRSANE